MRFRTLVINPGSTSTKIAVYDDESAAMLLSLTHSLDELAGFERAIDQLEFRLALVLHELEHQHIPLQFDAVIGRGGMIRPVSGGVYEVNDRMLDDLLHSQRDHVCNLGAPLAYRIAAGIEGCHAYIADPVVVDELAPVARITGSPLMPRLSIWHALNQRAVAMRFAAECGTRYEDLNLIVCHMGGGITVAAHDHGHAVDVNNGLDGEGPLSPERAGTLPAADLIRLCYSGRYTETQLLRRIAGQAGLAAHLGTTDVREITTRIELGDEKAQCVLDAMIYQTAKQIAAQSAVLYGQIDAVLITGGIAYSNYVIDHLRPRIEHLAPVYVYPGEDEMRSLNSNALRVLRGQCKAKVYE
ncbi:MAG: butyrate kinase [Prevotellaceae bacterium]|nr:butyrate kinase [Prevotellaceae bacterium]